MLLLHPRQHVGGLIVEPNLPSLPKTQSFRSEREYNEWRREAYPRYLMRRQRERRPQSRGSMIPRVARLLAGLVIAPISALRGGRSQAASDHASARISR